MFSLSLYCCVFQPAFGCFPQLSDLNLSVKLIYWQAVNVFINFWSFNGSFHYYTSNFEEKISNHGTDNLFEYTFEVWSFIWSNHNYKVILEMRPQRPVIKVHSDCFSWLSFYTNIIVIVSSRNLDVETGLSHTTSKHLSCHQKWTLCIVMSGWCHFAWGYVIKKHDHTIAILRASLFTCH